MKKKLLDDQITTRIRKHSRKIKYDLGEIILFSFVLLGFSILIVGLISDGYIAASVISTITALIVLILMISVP